MKRSFPHLLVAVSLGLLCLACTSTTGNEANIRSSAVFPADKVCGYPLAAPGLYFTNLGKTTWQPLEPAREDSPYACGPQKPSVRIHDDAAGTIDVEFSAAGGPKGAHMISLTYTAAGARPIPNESTLRRMFGNLADAISKEGLGPGLPEYFHKRVANLNSYSKPGKGSPETFELGEGFVTLTRQATDDRLGIEIYVKFYPDLSYKLK